ncbi:molybdate ABC transporter substrate-binding protein [Gallibacterium salpingitidis]|uniref:molybdate ABC transporter substrate-binding protein n=1 Tax=Gallibacterium salpingitidis TaxID=505341 RepID=UPI00267015AC|nr:molybdate ABC transporter substrate-binding protein [Gallibacterium salpingitidis]WKT00900.1 molybdate ABC transporter substrate-binding protein [Gallibacterium salpingitidis]
MFKKLLVTSLLALTASLANAEQVTVFAAASMTNALQQVAEDYKKKLPADEIVFSFASSSTLAKQIAEGAPANIFISANTKWMDYLKAKGLTVAGSDKILVGNELVMIANQDSKIDQVDVAKGEWIKQLDNNFLSVGDPDHVPAGQYMKAATTKLGFWDKIESKLARGKDVRAALALVERNEAPLGVVYGTDAKQSKKVKIVGVFPADSYPKVEYPVALLKDHDSKAAKAFFDYLQSDDAKKVFTQYGFSVAK